MNTNMIKPRVRAPSNQTRPPGQRAGAPASRGARSSTRCSFPACRSASYRLVCFAKQVSERSAELVCVGVFTEASARARGVWSLEKRESAVYGALGVCGSV